MRRKLAIVLSLCALVAIVVPTAALAQDSADLVAIDAVLAEIQSALSRADTTELPTPRSAKVTLQTAVVRKSGVRLNLWIVKLGARYETTNSHTVRFKFRVPKKLSDGQLASLGPSLSDQFVSAIDTAVKAFERAEQGDPPLEGVGFEIELNFTVRKEAGIEVPILEPIEAGFDHKRDRTAVHTILLRFGSVNP